MPKGAQRTVTRKMNPKSFADVEFHHSVADFAVIDDGTRVVEELLRPVVTIAMDRATRMILGIGIAQFPLAAMRNCIDDMIRRDINADK